MICTHLMLHWMSRLTWQASWPDSSLLYFMKCLNTMWRILFLKRKYKINATALNTASTSYATNRRSRACQLSNPHFTWRAVCMESFLSTGWPKCRNDFLWRKKDTSLSLTPCVDRLGGLTAGGKDLGGQVFLRNLKKASTNTTCHIR
jgi:hypothetical protein